MILCGTFIQQTLSLCLPAREPMSYRLRVSACFAAPRLRSGPHWASCCYSKRQSLSQRPCRLNRQNKGLGKQGTEIRGPSSHSSIMNKDLGLHFLHVRPVFISVRGNAVFLTPFQIVCHSVLEKEAERPNLLLLFSSLSTAVVSKASFF